MLVLALVSLPQVGSLVHYFPQEHSEQIAAWNWFRSYVLALQTLKKALGLPPRFGWNGDPCVPQQHPWIEADCQLNKSSSKWLIDGL
ncbi:receptor-like protein 4 [Arachis stenosperma]|uniref:receptor-like protein 4 n=1 Tax=Arachis stenosperma TaxID=217475 RepID=UPI0025ABC523|nr:receptor-like protein 4 [Arachis stenosperma]